MAAAAASQPRSHQPTSLRRAPPPSSAAAKPEPNEKASNSKPASPVQAPSPERTVKKLRLAKALTLPEATSVSEACRRMALKRVDAALLTDSNGMLSGILTAEDISGRVIAEGLRPDETNVAKAMTRNPVFVMSNSPAIEALQKMVKGKFRHLPVVEHGEVIAMLDITKFLYDAISRMEKAAEQGSAIAAAMEGVERQWGNDFPGPHSFIENLRDQLFKPSLSTIITENNSVPVVSPSDPVIAAAKKMREYRVNSVVVMTGNMLLGILTSKDLVLRLVAQSLSPDVTLVEKVEGASEANSMANTMMQKFWDSALALQPAEESDARSEESRMATSDNAEGKHIPPHVGNSFSFKLQDRKGLSESLDELVSAVSYRLGMEKEKINLLYDDDEGDRVVLTTDGDLSAAIQHARSAGWKVLRLHMDEPWSNGEHTTSLVNTSPVKTGRSFLRLGIAAGAVAVASMGVIFRTAYWLRFWAQLQRCDEDEEFLKVARRRLRSVLRRSLAGQFGGEVLRVLRRLRALSGGAWDSHMEKSRDKVNITPDLNKGKETVIPLHITRLDMREVDQSSYVARLKLKKPSNIPPSTLPLHLPVIGLDVNKPDNLHCLMIMQNVKHRNVLQMEAVKQIVIGEAKTPVLAMFVESFTGRLPALLRKMKLGGMQIIEGWEELRVNGLYHGNICLENVYYCKDNEKITIKLANFQSKGAMSKEAAQLEDINAIGRMLKSISALAKIGVPHQAERYMLVDHLAMNLEFLANTQQIGTIKDVILDHVFFWFKERRKRFFIYDIPKALKDAAFCNNVRRGQTCVLEWDKKPHHGLLGSMNRYRKTNLNLPAYDGNDPIQNVKFVSGAYTHEEEVQDDLTFNGMSSTVDEAVQSEQPMLCLNLYKCLSPEGPLANQS
ncbi:hypothetical protein OsJ_04848 [Oryza sativa Japonica Group]|uniref:Uncharacterized protein n=2 Tax=Oryza sativa subsp. japonica TaxID=39947 RepID=B9EWK8_ORYSJ|nr:hypothetical protein OsJ_04848 [Oryza sativa Japonica Group]